MDSSTTTEQGFGRTQLVALAVSCIAGGLALGYVLGRRFALAPQAVAKAKGSRVNSNCLKQDCDKVVDTVDMEDIGEKKAFCRCWRSKKFPYCDGTHTVHNRETGDNVGPLIVKGVPPVGKSA